DLNDNLVRLDDMITPEYSVDNMSYDGVDRLLTADGYWGAGYFEYDGLGNIIHRSYGSSDLELEYDSSNRLAQVRGIQSVDYDYDARGNVTDNGRYHLSYNRAQQLVSANSVDYLYDGHNRRVKKSTSRGTEYSFYSKAGHLLYRKSDTGQVTE